MPLPLKFYQESKTNYFNFVKGILLTNHCEQPIVYIYVAGEGQCIYILKNSYLQKLNNLHSMF